MGFFDSLDGNLDDLLGNLNYLKKKLVSESQEIKKAARLRYELLNEERKLSEAFEKLGKHQYHALKGEVSNLDVSETLQEIERLESRISSLKMGLDLSEKTSGISFTEENSSKDAYESSSIVVRDEEDSSHEEDQGSIIFIEEDEDENR